MTTLPVRSHLLSIGCYYTPTLDVLSSADFCLGERYSFPGGGEKRARPTGERRQG